MGKRKRTDSKEPPKRQKTHSESENTESADITKQSKNRAKENIPWTDSDLLQLISKIEENTPEDDYLSYTSRLEKIDWSNIPFKTHSVKECQETWTTLVKQVRKFRLLKEIVDDVKDLVRNPKKSHVKDAVVRHPDKPKQPPNSYMLFVTDKRQEVVNKHPTLPPNDVSRKLGELFRGLPMKEKEKYDQRARISREEYAIKLQDFYSEHPEMIPKKTKRRSKSVQLEEGRGPPEKPKTPFQLYMQVEGEKEEFVDTAKFTLNQKCRDNWNKMNDKDKLFWINWAEEQYHKYTEDLKEYIKVHPEYEPDNIKTILTKQEKKIKVRCSDKPQKPPRSAYHLFSKMLMESEEVHKINSRDLVNYVSEKWKACSDEEKNEYKVRIDQMWEEYHQKMDEYLTTVPPNERDEIQEQKGQRKRKTAPNKDAGVEKKTEEIKMRKPEIPPSTEYKYFLSKYQGKENPLVIWQHMTAEEKEAYKEELEEERRNYIVSYEQYLKSLTKEELKKFCDSLGDRYDTSSSESESEMSE